MKEVDTFSRAKLLELIDLQDDQLTSKFEQLAQQAAQLQTKDAQLQAKDELIRQLEQQRNNWEQAYTKLWQERFAARSERYITDPDQLRIDFGDTPEANDAAAGLGEALEEADLIPAHRRRKPKKKRDDSLPAHLPRYEVLADVTELQKNCDTHGEKSLLPEAMWDKTETLEFTPPSLKVRVTKYPKYACPADPLCGITSAKRPAAIVQGNKYDASVAAEIISAKFSYHLPIYRQQDWFAGSGWTPGRSTLLNILAGCAELLVPLLEFFQQTLQQDSVIGCDDTSVTLLYPKELPQLDLNDAKERRIAEVFANALAENKPSINAKMWAYRGVNVKLNVFDFTVSRHRDGPELFFADFTGTLLGDCWHGFESIALNSNGTIVRAACVAHARRKIRESVAYPTERRLWMEWFGELYDIEDRGRNMSAEERLLLRQSESRAVWDRMSLWLAEVQSRTTNVILPKSDFAGALRYIRNHFAELTRYVEQASIPIDNNQTEQLMKQIAIGRKNWLFAGSVAGGQRSAGFFTLVSSALRNDLDVWRYVQDVLVQLLSGISDYTPLLPWNWASTHPESIRQYRIEERTDRAERKSQSRADRRTPPPRR